MMNKFLYKFSAFLFALVLFMPIACVDTDFDQPPAGGEDPNLPVNITIAELKSRHVIGEYEEITDDVTFQGLVVSDDREGNFFKQLIVQDETGGIELRIEITDLYNVYPVGRKVYVHAKGLWLGDYGGLTQLGAAEGVDNSGNPTLLRIPESIADLFIITATYGNPVTPTLVTVDELSLDMVSTLVRFENMQFIAGDAGQTYADAILQQTLNREIEDCSKKRVIVRTSGFSSFAGDSTPVTNGEIIGVLSVFRDDYQLTIRDLNDVDMEEGRCGTGNVVTIASVRDMFSNGTTTVPAASIKGVVTSDYTSQSVTGRSLYIEDGTAGIVLRFDANHPFTLGNEIAVDITGASLSEFNGLLQVDGLSAGAGFVVSNPGDVTPRDATVLEVLNNVDAWESTLVRIKNATLSGNTVFGGDVTVTDGSGSMVLFTRNQAVFASNALPSGEVTLTALLSEFNSPNLIMRNITDVSGGVPGGCVDTDTDFEGLGSDVDINLPGWSNIAVKGARVWRTKEFDSNTYAQATAFGDNANEMEAWLVTPCIDLDIAKKITFVSAYGFYTHDGLTVWISSDFNGSDVNGATWQQLNPTLATSSDTEHAFIPSGTVDLSGFTGSVRIGFKYVGSGPGSQTTSFRIDDVKVEAL